MGKHKAKFKFQLPYIVINDLSEAQKSKFESWLLMNNKSKLLFEENTPCAFYWDYENWYNDLFIKEVELSAYDEAC